MKTQVKLYQQTATETSPPARLVAMLCRGAIRSIRRAAEAIERNDIETAHICLIRAQSLMQELRSGLPRGNNPIIRRFHTLSDYFQRRLVQANAAKDKEAALEVVSLLESLLDPIEDALTACDGVHPQPPGVKGPFYVVP